MVAFSTSAPGLVHTMGLRDFQRSMYSHIRNIKDTPLVLTRNKKPYLVILSYAEYMKLGVREAPTTLERIQVNNTPMMKENPTILDRIWKILTKKIA